MFIHDLVLWDPFANDTRWDKLNLVRVYTKPKGKMPDYSAPVVLRSSRCTVEDFVSSSWISALATSQTDSIRPQHTALSS